MEMLEVKNLSKSFTDHLVLKKINFRLTENKSYAFVGVSGCGKTTLARIIIGLEQADCGEIYFQNQALKNLKSRSLKQKKQIQMVFQNALGSFNPRQKISTSLNRVFEIHKALSLSKSGKSKEQIRKTKIFDLLELLELDQSIIFKYPHQVSGGQIQRLSILRALLCEPKILIADEPTSALDVLSKKNLLSVLRKIKKNTQVSYFVITHDFSSLKALVDWVFVLDSGKIVEENSPEKILENPQHEHTKKLISSIPKIQVPQLSKEKEN